MFTNNDLTQIKEHGLTVEQIDAQLAAFRSGFPFLKLYSAATVDNGIIAVSSEDEKKYVSIWNEYLASDGDILKFVPASGAASRMFKALFEFLDGEEDLPSNDFMKKFFREIHNFAFFDTLDKAVKEATGKSIDDNISNQTFKPIVACLLKAPMCYGSLPKALLQFHKIGDEIHTSLAEHLEEGAQYAMNKKGEVKVHFTVSHEHKALFDGEIEKTLPLMSEIYHAKYDISMSEQKPSTDTIAVNKDNTPFRNDDGTLLFRPGGHGALIENLNDQDATIIFIKNIDNVVPRTLRQSTIDYKKIIGGILVETQEKIAQYLTLLDSGNYTMDQVLEIVHFLQSRLNVRNEQTKHLEDSELVVYLKSKLNRPIRVCGVVKNEGEPGGGPYVAYNQDGTSSLQILESSQINPNDDESMKLMKEATHFNPVDLVCYIKDYKGNKFDLTKYVDKNTGFISEKSKSGRELRALELPGLWNGAMSDWNTIFVEVPISTFNPVKTVNDLLRPSHQG